LTGPRRYLSLAQMELYAQRIPRAA
jgi:hypothetical protein